MIRLELSARGVVLLLALLASLWLLIRVWPVLLLGVISLMFVAALYPFVEWMVSRGLSRVAAVLVVAFLLVVVAAAIGLLVVPVLIEEMRALVENSPEIRQRVVTFLENRGATGVAQDVQQLEAGDVAQPGLLASTGRRALGVVTSIFTVIFLTAYILLDIRRIEQFLYFSLPARYHGHARTLLVSSRRVVGGYIRGQLITSLSITAFTFVVLFAVGVPNALALAVLAGIADVIPLIGAYLAIGPSVLVALTVSVPRALIVVGLLVAYQEFENRILIPRVYGATMRLPGVAVFVALLIGAELLGILGALLALPAAAALRVFIEYANDVRRGRVPADGTTEATEQPFGPDEEAVTTRQG
jgi:predicted PurR-regulated permease PerM